MAMNMHYQNSYTTDYFNIGDNTLCDVITVSTDSVFHREYMMMSIQVDTYDEESLFKSVRCFALNEEGARALYRMLGDLLEGNPEDLGDRLEAEHDADARQSDTEDWPCRV